MSALTPDLLAAAEAVERSRDRHAWSAARWIAHDINTIGEHQLSSFGTDHAQAAQADDYESRHLRETWFAPIRARVGARCPMSIPTLTEAKDYVQYLLQLASGDGDRVERALDLSVRESRKWMSHTEESEDTYAMYRLALADLTGNPAYRGIR